MLSTELDLHNDSRQPCRAGAAGIVRNAPEECQASERLHRASATDSCWRPERPSAWEQIWLALAGGARCLYKALVQSQARRREEVSGLRAIQRMYYNAPAENVHFSCNIWPAG